MNEYRVTIRTFYPKGCVGHTDPHARQGHYTETRNEIEAALDVFVRLNKAGYGVVSPADLDVELWKVGGAQGGRV